MKNYFFVRDYFLRDVSGDFPRQQGKSLRGDKITKKVKEILKVILNRFKSGDISQAIAHSVFSVLNLPSSKWSILNMISDCYRDLGKEKSYRPFSLLIIKNILR